jgi:hypothetical protein
MCLTLLIFTPESSKYRSEEKELDYSPDRGVANDLSTRILVQK